jgi:hypothetical protein
MDVESRVGAVILVVDVDWPTEAAVERSGRSVISVACPSCCVFVFPPVAVGAGAAVVPAVASSVGWVVAIVEGGYSNDMC